MLFWFNGSVAQGPHGDTRDMSDDLNQDDVAAELYALHAPLHNADGDTRYDQVDVALEGYQDAEPERVLYVHIHDVGEGVPAGGAGDGAARPARPARLAHDASVQGKRKRDACNADRRARRREATIKDLRHQLVLKDHQMRSLLSTVQPREQRRQKPFNGFKLALQRNVGNASAKAAGVFENVTRHQVTDWELKAGVCILARAADFFIENEQRLVDSAWGQSDRRWHGSVFSWRGDATKSKSWKEEKMQGLHLIAKYMYGPNDVHRHEVWPDCQVVSDATTVGNWVLMKRQLLEVQCRALSLSMTACPQPAECRRDGSPTWEIADLIR